MGKLDDQLAGLATMSPAQLRKTWRKVAGTTLPKVSANMLRLAIGYQLQAKAHGTLVRANRQQLDQLAASVTRTTAAQPGMRLVREWKGTVHIVMVGEDKVFRWNNRDWNSLSSVARAITGTRWSGPAFFGLKRRMAA
jgi:antitoxin component of MazEF toxin-antitoxin module